MNHSLYMSTDWAMSDFQSSGLLRLTGTFMLREVEFPHFGEQVLEPHLPPCRFHLDRFGNRRRHAEADDFEFARFWPSCRLNVFLLAHANRP